MAIVWVRVASWYSVCDSGGEVLSSTNGAGFRRLGRNLDWPTQTPVKVAPKEVIDDTVIWKLPGPNVTNWLPEPVKEKDDC